MYRTPYVTELHNKFEAAERIRLAEHYRQIRQIDTGRRHQRPFAWLVARVKHLAMIDHVSGSDFAAVTERLETSRVDANPPSPAEP
jgi:hypothetical protein